MNSKLNKRRKEIEHQNDGFNHPVGTLFINAVQALLAYLRPGYHAVSIPCFGEGLN